MILAGATFYPFFSHCIPYLLNQSNRKMCKVITEKDRVEVAW